MHCTYRIARGSAMDDNDINLANYLFLSKTINHCYYYYYFHLSSINGQLSSHPSSVYFDFCSGTDYPFKMLKFVLILAVLPAVILGDRIAFTACNGGGPLPTWAAVEGCSMDGCTVVNGAEITLSAELPVTVGANSLITTVDARWAIIEDQLELPDHVLDGCNAFESGCPLTVGNTEFITNSFVVAARISNITPTIEFAMTNENGEKVICVQTQINLISG